jgi:hypothetical protein
MVKYVMAARGRIQYDLNKKTRAMEEGNAVSMGYVTRLLEDGANSNGYETNIPLDNAGIWPF